MTYTCATENQELDIFQNGKCERCLEYSRKVDELFLCSENLGIQNAPKPHEQTGLAHIYKNICMCVYFSYNHETNIKWGKSMCALHDEK